MKKIISFLLILILFLSLFVGFTSSNKSYFMRNKVKDILKNRKLLNAKINEEKPLYNLNEKFIGYLIEVEDLGYFIFSLESNTIIEYSLDNPSPYRGKTSKLYYNGFSNYYIKNNNQFINLLTKKNLLWQNSLKGYLPSDNEYYLMPEDDFKTNNITTSIAYETNLSNALKTWGSSDYYCVVDSLAIMLEYYDRIHSTRYVPDNYNSDSLLQEYLVYNEYLANSEQHLYKAVDGWTYDDIDYMGLNDYLDTFVCPLDAYDKYLDFDFNLLKNSIESEDEPVIIAIRNYNGGNYHAVVAHGTIEISDGSKYIRLNDTYGRNNINYMVSSDIDQMLWLD